MRRLGLGKKSNRIGLEAEKMTADDWFNFFQTLVQLFFAYVTENGNAVWEPHKLHPIYAYILLYEYILS